MPDYMLKIAVAGALVSFGFPVLLLVFSALLIQTRRRANPDPSVPRTGEWTLGVSALSIALYVWGASTRWVSLCWASVALLVLAAALCGWFLLSNPPRSLKIISGVLLLDILLAAAFLPYGIWIANEAQRVSAYSNPNEAEVRAALAKNPNDAAAHSSLGMIDDRRGDESGAITEWREALRAEPDNVDALLLLGAALTRAGKVDEARPLFQRLAARHDQFSPNARRWLARHGTQ